MPTVTAYELIQMEKEDNKRTYGHEVDNIGMAEIVVGELLPLLDGLTHMLSPQTQMWLTEHDTTTKEAASPDERSSDISSLSDEQGSVQPVEGESGRTGLFAYNRILVGDT